MDDVNIFTKEYLEDLVSMAIVSTRHRQHRNIHSDYLDPCQRLFNAIEPDSYLRPHCHGPEQGAETILAIKGLMALVIFDSIGNIEKIQKFGPYLGTENKNLAIGVEIPIGKWHTVLSLESGSILFETKAGPFNPETPKFFAQWAPEEGSPAGNLYLRDLLLAIGFNTK